MEGEGGSWDALSPDTVERIALFLSPNEVACSLRLLNKSTARALLGWRTVHLSQPVPRHAFIKLWGDGPSLHGRTLEQRQRFICLVARSGIISNLEVAIAAAGCRGTVDVYAAAAAEGHVHVCMWLDDRCEPLETSGSAVDRVADAAAAAGRTATVQWLLRRCPHPSTRRWLAGRCLLAAAGAGHQLLCDELLEEGAHCVWKAVCYAAEGGHLALTEWLLAKCQEAQASGDGGAAGIDYGQLLPSAAYGFELPALQRLYGYCVLTLGSSRRGSDSTTSANTVLLFAALVGPSPDWHLKFEWLEATLGCRLDDAGFRACWRAKCSPGSRWQGLAARPDAAERLTFLHRRALVSAAFPELLTDAVQCNNSRLVRWLRAEGLMRMAPADPNDKPLDLPVQSADVAILGELLAAGWRIQRTHVLAAARCGRLEVLQLLARPEAGPAADAALRKAVEGAWLLEAAAASGSLELVAWLREAGCAWDAHSFNSAARSGNAVLLEWMSREGCTMWHSGQPYLDAGRNMDFATLRCLRRLGAPWDPSGSTFSNACSDCWGRGCAYLEVLQWLLDEGCPVDWREAVKRAERGSNAKVLAWVRSRAAAAGMGAEGADCVGAVAAAGVGAVAAAAAGAALETASEAATETAVEPAATAAAAPKEMLGADEMAAVKGSASPDVAETSSEAAGQAVSGGATPGRASGGAC